MGDIVGDLLNCLAATGYLTRVEREELAREVRRLRAVEAAARAFRQSESRLLNYRDPHYPQHEADHLAARRALRDALGDGDS